MDAEKRELFERDGALAALLQRTVIAKAGGAASGDLKAELDRRDADAAAAAGACIAGV